MSGPAHPGGDGRLARLLGGEDTAWLVRRARERMQAGRPLTGSVTKAGATERERIAVAALTGRPARSGASLSISLDEVDSILRASGAAPGGLAEAVTRLTGPVRNLAAERESAAAAWAAAFAILDGAVQDRPELGAWRQWVDAAGLVRRLAPEPATAAALLTQVAVVLRRLPAAGVPLGRLAAECCGGAHALDDKEPVATLVLPAARALAGLPLVGDGMADSRRAAWAAVGVHVDDLSSTVLCLGLPGDVRTPLGRVLAACQEAGQPAVLTLRQLRIHDGPVLAHDGSLRGGTAWTCENPVVVAAAADDLGSACPPLVCVNGRPSAAAIHLLDMLAASGTEFRSHDDFDWGGIRIAAALRGRYGPAWRPWRYDAAAYAAALAAIIAAHPGWRSPPLPGDPVLAPWDPALTAALSRENLRVEEELVLDDILSDLAAVGRQGQSRGAGG